MRSSKSLKGLDADVFVLTRRRKVAGLYREVVSRTSMPSLVSKRQRCRHR